MAGPAAIIDMIGKGLTKAGTTAVGGGDTLKNNQLVGDDYYRQARNTALTNTQNRYANYNDRMSRADSYLASRQNPLRQYNTRNAQAGALQAYGQSLRPALRAAIAKMPTQSMRDQEYGEDLKMDAARMGLNLTPDMVAEFQGSDEGSNYFRDVGLPQNGVSSSIKNLAMNTANRGEQEWTNMQNQSDELAQLISQSYDNSSHQSSTMNALQRFGLLAAILGSTMQNGSSNMGKAPTGGANG